MTLTSFTRMYPNAILDQIRSKVPAAQHEKGVVYYLTGESDGAELRRKELDKYLEVAYRLGAMDADLEKRLRSVDWNAFFQALGEIKVAYFFERVIGWPIRFRPMGQGTSVGEFCANMPDGRDLFVEVKCPIRQPANRCWCGHDGKVVYSNVKRAYDQIPKTDMPTLVVLAGEFRGGLSNEFSGPIQGLYGQPGWKVPIGPNGQGGPIKPHIKLDGFFQPRIRRHLSAVATLEDLVGFPLIDATFAEMLDSGACVLDNPNDPWLMLKYIFRVYHNPYAGNPLGAASLCRWRQFAPTTDGTCLEWREPYAATRA